MKEMSDRKNLCDVLEAASQENGSLFLIQEEGKKKQIAYQELYQRAQGVLYNLKQSGITRKHEVLLQIEDNEQFLLVFWACVLGGIVVVPLHTGVSREQKNQMFQVMHTLKHPKLIAGKKIYQMLVKEAASEIKEQTICVEEVLDVTQYAKVYFSKPQDIAYIQFSSGSTGTPKGVKISHENAVFMVQVMCERVNAGKQDSILNWLPISHSYSLVVGHIMMLYAKGNQYLMPTDIFIKNPCLWMEIASEYQVTSLLSPNFGFQYFLSALEDERDYGWDLSRIRIVSMGGEPIDNQVCRNFCEVLQRYGNVNNPIYPSYGLTESTVAVSSPVLGEELRTFCLERDSVRYGCHIKHAVDKKQRDVMQIIEVGRPYNGCHVRICNAQEEVLSEEYVGSIQLKGKNITTGYYCNEKANQDAFTKDGWLRTGDVGFLSDGKLFITGREKDIIFVNGQNYYPNDMERLVREMDGFEKKEVAACGVWNQKKQKEEILIFILSKEPAEVFSEKAEMVKKHISNCTGLEVCQVLPIKKFPKTSSGKIQRFKLVEQYQNGIFDKMIEKMKQIGQLHFAAKKKKPKNILEEKITKLWSAVLKIDNFSVDQSFFELGGDSLKATFLVNRLKQEFRVDITLRDLFLYQTVENLALCISRMQMVEIEQIKPAGQREYYPLSSAQKRMYALYEMDKESVSYHITQVVTVEGEFSVYKARKAFLVLAERHESLRTSFALKEGMVVQQIQKEPAVDISYKEAEEEQIEQVIEQFVTPFDLEKVPLYRVCVVKTGQQKYYLILDIHHIISDGISISVLMKEFIEIYEGKMLPKKQQLDYKDYAVWQAEKQDREKLERQKEYWLQQFREKPPVLNLPTDFKRPAVQQFAGDTYHFRIGMAMTEKLKQLCQKTNTTLNMILFSAFSILLYRYAGQDDIVIGTVASGREYDEIKETVGMFVNSLAVRSRVKEKESYVQYLQRVKEKLLNISENSEYPLEELLEELHIKRDSSRNPLFDVMFVMENMDIPKGSLKKRKYGIYDYNAKGTKLDLTLRVQERDDGIIGFLQYSTALFSRQTIERFAEYYKKIISEIIKEPQKQIKDIEMLLDSEKEKVLKRFQGKQVPFYEVDSYSKLFFKRVQKTPERIAVVCGEKTLTYRELNQKADELAETLRKCGIQRNKFVGLLLERSVYIPIAILAVMKAGGAFMPIDTEYPEERIQYMLEESSACVCVTQENQKSKIHFNGNIIDLDEENSYGKCVETELENTSGKDAAYLIFTSGSTGKPKGVVIEHHSLVNYVSWFSKEVELTEQDKTVLLSSYAFDLSYTSLFSILLSGGELHIVSKDQYMDSEKLLHYLEEQQITYIKATPSLLNMLVNAYDFPRTDACKSLRLLVLGGEPIKTEVVKAYHEKYPQAQIYNHYGPTECTIGCIAGRINWEQFEEFQKSPTIGKPIDNVKVYILDKKKKPTAIGQPGEIYIAGAGLAREYLKREQLTRERFLKNPFQPEERIYKTGDIGKFLENGSIVFEERMDDQIKIRGYRIELGEIESRMADFPGIERCTAAAVSEGEEKAVCLYYAAKTEFPENELRMYLRTRLPVYMIPAYFVRLDEIPLTRNGKVDRQALPNPEPKQNRSDTYVKPETDTECRLEKLWNEVLGVSKSGIDDNFFEYGGHSLKASVLAAKIRQEFQVVVEMKEIFSKPTIRELAKCINAKNQEIFYEVEASPKQDDYPVSSTQKRLYALCEIEKDSVAYNMPCVYEIKGSLEKEKIESALKEIFRRHEIFRTVLVVSNGKLVQKVYEQAEVKIEYQESNESVEQILKEFVKPFDLGRLPLVRVKIVKAGIKKHYLFLDMHHTIFDGVSIGIFINELNHLYRGEKLEPLKIQYRDYAVWQRKWQNSENYKKQEQFWMQMFKEEVPALELPCDYERPKVQNFEGSSVKFELGRELTKKLKKQAGKDGMTLFMLLFGAFSILLSKYSGQEDIVAGTAEAGRHHADLQKLIGSFINTLAIRTRPSGEKTIREYYKEVKENCFQALECADYPLEELLEKREIHHEMGRNALFDTMFILENVEDTDILMDGLTFRSYELENKVSKFDLLLVGNEEHEILSFELKYAVKLFRRETVQRLKDSYLRILEEIVRNPEQKIKDISVLSESEYNKLTVQWNHTSVSYPKEETILSMFQKQVFKTPERIAVCAGGENLSYTELDKKSDRIAEILVDRGVKKGSIVGILTERSVWMMVGIFGILKAGGAYLPISENYPQRRISFLLEDSLTRIVVTEKRLYSKIRGISECICMDEELIYQMNEENILQIEQDRNSLAYVIYTSGTTGQPKGVMLEQHSVVNLVYALNDKIYKKYHRSLNIALAAPYVFDASVKQIFAALLLGHTLHIIPEEARRDGELLVQFYKKHQIDVSDGTPVHLEILSELPGEILGQIPVTTFLIGGEVLRNQLVKRLYDKMQAFSNKMLPEIVNVYGPTECCVDATMYRIDAHNMEQEILIGKPLPNVRLYVLDAYQKLVPEGVVGELYIAGEGVARGYLRRLELTKEKFLEEPRHKGQRMYRTGDYVKWNKDGSIQYIDRMDYQVKVRGFRMELSEIEKQLEQILQVKKAVVLARCEDGSEKYLCAYVVLQEKMSGQELRNALSKELPEYMIPSYFVFLEEMPITENGKVDREKLPKPTPDLVAMELEMSAPENDIQTILSKAWCEVLGLSEVGIDSSFYAMGGDSIKAIQISAKLREQKWKLLVRDLLRYQTIREVSQYVTYAGSRNEQEMVSGAMKLLPIQRDFFARNYKNENYYNQSAAVYRKNGLDKSIIVQTMEALMEHHDVLRMVFCRKEDKVSAEILPYKKMNGFQLSVFWLEAENWKAELKEKAGILKAGLDIEKGPLIWLGLFHQKDGDYLVFIAHHLIVDGVSWRILLEDFKNVYNQIEQGERPLLPEKTDSYGQWAEMIYAYGESDGLKSQIPYWTEQILKKKELPKEKINSEKKYRKDCAAVSFSLEEEQTYQLLTKANEAYHTETSDLLLTAFVKAMKQWGMEDGVLVSLEGHGREAVSEESDVTRTVGWFTTRFPVWLSVADCENTGRQIKEIKEEIRHIPDKGIGYLILKYITLEGKPEQQVFLERPEISFNYLGQFEEGSQEELFSFADLDTGEDISGENEFLYTLSIIGRISCGQLAMNIIYHKKDYGKSSMEKLAGLYQQALKEVISCCVEKQEQEFTPGDFDDESLTLEELENITGMLGDIEL